MGSAIFLLADQPQIPVDVIRALVESHGQNMQAILAPLVLEERRANPVLFDRDTFPDLMQLTGDVGGRGIFDKHRVEYLPWHDDILLLDVDKPEDYQRLKETGMNISAMILAAGKSVRMGQQKMLMPWGNTTVLGKVIETLQAAGVEDIILVTNSKIAPANYQLQITNYAQR